MKELSRWSHARRIRLGIQSLRMQFESDCFMVASPTAAGSSFRPIWPASQRRPQALRRICPTTFGFRSPRARSRGLSDFEFHLDIASFRYRRFDEARGTHKVFAVGFDQRPGLSRTPILCTAPQRRNRQGSQSYEQSQTSTIVMRRERRGRDQEKGAGNLRLSLSFNGLELSTQSCRRLACAHVSSWRRRGLLLAERWSWLFCYLLLASLAVTVATGCRSGDRWRRSSLVEALREG